MEMGEKTFFTSESVTEGHPDKVADQIADAVLDAYLGQDPGSRVAVEVMVTSNYVLLAGEVTSQAQVDVERVARGVIKDVGYSPYKVLVVPQNATMAFRTLLVASDGSPCSNAAWGEALALARETQAELYAISVARKEGEIVQTEEIIQRLISAANHQRIPIQGLVPLGLQPDDTIVQEALRYKVDIIIMGSHGRTGVKRLLMGSVTERVIGQTTCPVLVIKKSCQPFEMTRIKPDVLD